MHRPDAKLVCGDVSMFSSSKINLYTSTAGLVATSL